MTATVAVTFDNLGEAAELERGQWPEGEPLGRHFSVCEALPRVLDALDEADVRATFFVEGLNAELYPDTLRRLGAAGHEVACHGWRHEPWSELDAAGERARLERSLRGMGELGLRPVGFRPPGGEPGPATLGTLRELGFAYCSPAGTEVGTREGVVLLPFRWEHIDAYHYLPSFAGLRERLTGSGDPLPPAALRAAVSRALDETARGGGHLTLIFHPFLADTEERLDVIRDVLRDVRGAAWCGACRDAVGLEPLADDPRALDERAQLGEGEFAGEVLHPAVRADLQPLGGDHLERRLDPLGDLSASPARRSERSSTPTITVLPAIGSAPPRPAAPARPRSRARRPRSRPARPGTGSRPAVVHHVRVAEAGVQRGRPGRAGSARSIAGSANSRAFSARDCSHGSSICTMSAPAANRSASPR